MTYDKQQKQAKTNYNRKPVVSGAIYNNKGRWWWKVRVDGKLKQIPLKPVGATYATKDRRVAEEVAKRLYEEMQLDTPAEFDGNLTTLIKLYQAWAANYYQPPSREATSIKTATDPIKLDMAASEYSPLDLKNHLADLVATGLSRTTINRRLGYIKRMFKWAVSEMMIPAYTYQAVNTVEGLKRGRTPAPDARKILPVPLDRVKKTLPHLGVVVADMVRLQMLTGMRSGELCKIRPGDIDTSGTVWIYKPPHHKGSYLGHQKVITIGPQAQEVLTPYLDRPADEYCFKPAEADAQFRAEKHAKRKTALSCGNRPGEVDASKFREKYDSAAYYKAIQRACAAGKIESWHPHQLRHTAATDIAREYGIEAARVILGHRNLAVTDLYAEIDLQKAIKIAEGR